MIFNLTCTALFSSFSKSSYTIPTPPFTYPPRTYSYTVDLMIPEDIDCERCVLQMTYQTANSADGFPETFWNCADVAVTASSASSSASNRVAYADDDDIEGRELQGANAVEGSGDDDRDGDDDDSLDGVDGGDGGGDGDGDSDADGNHDLQEIVHAIRSLPDSSIVGIVVGVGAVVLVVAGVYGRVYPPQPGSRGHAGFSVTNYNTLYSNECTPLLGDKL